MAEVVLAGEAPVAVGNGTPKWFPRKVSQKDLDLIAEAVRLAEEKTTGEIVPMVVRSSISTGHVPLILALMLFALGLFVEVEFNHEIAGLLTMAPQWLLAPIIFVICYLVSLPLAKIDIVARVLTSNRDEAHAVEVRAEIEFHRGQYTKTTEHTAILIFVSLLERRAVVLADKSIADKIGNEEWAEIVNLLLAGLKKGDFVGGWQRAIARSGALLSAHFPASKHDKNEISNLLVIKE